MDTRAPSVDPESKGAPAPQARDSLVPSPPLHAGSDRFDEAIEVTRSRAWIGLASCVVLVLGIIVWAITTRVGVTVQAPGVALVNGAIAVVQSPVSGTVQTLSVKVDDAVQASQVIGTVTDAQNQASPLVAPVAGRVLNTNSDEGATVHAGEDVVSIAQTSGPLLIRLFVSPTEAEQVNVGEEAVMSFPEQPEVRGKVSGIGSLPLTKEQVADSIGSPALASHLVRGSAVVNITVTPTAPEPGRKQAKIDSGDVASVTLIVGSKRPIDYVV